MSLQRRFKKSTPPTKPAIIPIVEKHYTVHELAVAWCFSDNFIRKLFWNEPGVLRVSRPETLKKRRYTSLRIPASVAARVRARLQVAA
jgi:hypothetical protein